MIDTFEQGRIYTFSLSTSRFFEYKSDAWIKEQLTNLLQQNDMGSLVDMYRPVMNSGHVVKIKENYDGGHLSDWQQTFEYAYKKMGYNSVKIEDVKEGDVNVTLLTEVGDKLKSSGIPNPADWISKNLTKAVVIVGLLFVFYLILTFKPRRQSA